MRPTRGDDPEIARDLLDEVGELFTRHGLPEMAPGEDPSDPSRVCNRILMVSTHGYWSDPPPAGATDTGGQTLYVLQISREWARAGRKVLILARWFAPYARVDPLEPGLWLVRIPAGDDRFVRKEDIHPLAPEFAEYATAVAARFGAQAVMGHYADGMAVAAEIATRRGLPFLAMPHSLALTKITGLGLDPGDLATWFDEQYRFGAREEYELAAMTQADGVIGCLPDQLDVLSRVYRLRTRRDVVAPGVAPIFFEAGDAPPDPAIPARFGLAPGGYLVVTARLAETKNIPGAVMLLGEARALAPARFDRVTLAVVGGSPEPREPEEFAVEAKIEAAMARHGLTRRDVRRVPAQTWPIVAQLLRQSLFYVGMQHFEPFGMGAAEALAVGAPVLLSGRAGIARALEGARPGETCALLVDPADPRGAARRLLGALEAPAEVTRMSEAGRRLARQAFSWPNGAARLAGMLDELVARRAPARRVSPRGHHRLTSAWRGDRPRIASQHAWSAEQLLPWILEAQRAAARAGRRLVVALGGESGAGKTEIAHCLGIALRRHRLWSALLPGDVFFRRPPSANHELMLRNPAIGAPASGRLRFVTCASAPLHPEDVAAFEARFRVPLLNCYGLTEAGTWSAMSPIDPERDRRSVGTATGCRFRAVAVDGETRMPLPAGQFGELEVSGPSVMLGYDGDPEATARVLRDGWLSTGDLGWVDERGRVFLAGRSKDLIIRAGANIYPAEVEGVLLRHPQVAEAYVVGLDHAILGEQVAACVVRKVASVSDADLIRHCRAHLAPYKCPEAIRFIDAVPKSSRGKVSRAALKAVFASVASEAPTKESTMRNRDRNRDKEWATTDELLGAVLHRTITRVQFQAFVVAQWNAKRFAFRSEAIAAWMPKIAALAETAGVTHHGRPDQPVCPSRHLFGDAASIAARVVFDPPNTPERPETIEFHTHPVESVIVVLRGGGSYRMCHRDAAGRDVVVDVPLEAGSVVCFPGDVVHTIEVGPDGVETLNITDRLNQPAWRDAPTLRNTGPAASPDFARSSDPPAGAPMVPYAGFAAARFPGLL